MPNSPKVKLRWYQFSLRTLFVFTTLCAVACSWLAVKMQQARKQREAVEAIQKLGGEVKYDYQETTILNPQPPGPAWLRKLFGDDFFATVTSVRLSSDANLGDLKGLTDVRALFLSNIWVTDAGLENLTGMTQLITLFLDDTQVTDAGLEHLKGLTQLQMLYVGNTQVTEAGVTKLRQALPNCRIER
jgi:hypothetical protein